jgi:PadR family transcriptional regulator PadR
MRQTHALVQVAIALMESPEDRQWGYDLSRRSGVRSGALYPILSRMLEQQWMTDGWEDRREITDKRPPRRYYELTDVGRRELGAILHAASSDTRFSRLGTNLLDRSDVVITVLVALFAYGFCPGAFLRLIVLLYHREDPRREELIAELYVVPRRERPFWVVEQLEVALFEGLRKRLVWSATGRLFDRWTLSSGVKLNREFPTSFWIPDDVEKKAIAPGVTVKLVFRMTMMRHSETWAERMWVEVDKVGERRLVGRLVNEPAGIPRLNPGDTIKFSRDDIIDIDWEPDPAAQCGEPQPVQPLHASCNGHLDSHDCESESEDCSHVSHP